MKIRSEKRPGENGMQRVGRKNLLWVCILAIFITGCVPIQPTAAQKQYQATFLDLFNTVTTIVGRAENEELFREQVQVIYDQLLEYHQLFDIYNEYEGINNLKTINDNAGTGAVKVDERIIKLLLDCKKFYDDTDGKVNVAMGSVLSLWHDARTKGINDPLHAKLPDHEQLTAAAAHMDIEAVIIDEKASTVYIADPKVQLDVGAIAKGWATQRVAEMVMADHSDAAGFLISVGGNVCAAGLKDDAGTAWVVGINSPDEADSFLHTLYVSGGCVVTSGDYQRTYEVDGKLYHHIIDPDTLYPSEYWRSVTIVCEDSGVADALSTALFLVDRESGQKLLDRCNAMAMWVDRNGNLFYSPGFEELIRT